MYRQEIKRNVKNKDYPKWSNFAIIPFNYLNKAKSEKIQNDIQSSALYMHLPKWGTALNCQIGDSTVSGWTGIRVRLGPKFLDSWTK